MSHIYILSPRVTLDILVFECSTVQPTSARQPYSSMDQTVQHESCQKMSWYSELELVESTCIKLPRDSKPKRCVSSWTHRKLCSLTRNSFDYPCTACSRQFSTQEALESDVMHSKRHFWCPRCNRHFASRDAHSEHLEKSQRDWLCNYHSIDFSSNEALTGRYCDSHNHCVRCARFFVSAAAREEHYQYSRSHWICNTHASDYTTCQELYQHYESDPSHFWCSLCSKVYETSAQLKDVSRRSTAYNNS